MTTNHELLQKTSWNYRVIASTYDENVTLYAIHEVYYKGGLPYMYADDPAEFYWTSDDDDGAARRELHRFKRALSRPVLTGMDFNAEEDSNG